MMKLNGIDTGDSKAGNLSPEEAELEKMLKNSKQSRTYVCRHVWRWRNDGWWCTAGWTCRARSWRSEGLATHINKTNTVEESWWSSWYFCRRRRVWIGRSLPRQKWHVLSIGDGTRDSVSERQMQKTKGRRPKILSGRSGNSRVQQANTWNQHPKLVCHSIVVLERYEEVQKVSWKTANRSY